VKDKEEKEEGEEEGSIYRHRVEHK